MAASSSLRLPLPRGFPLPNLVSIAVGVGPHAQTVSGQSLAIGLCPRHSSFLAPSSRSIEAASRIPLASFPRNKYSRPLQPLSHKRLATRLRQWLKILVEISHQYIYKRSHRQGPAACEAFPPPRDFVGVRSLTT